MDVNGDNVTFDGTEAVQPGTALAIPQALRDQLREEAAEQKKSIQIANDKIVLTRKKTFKLPDGTENAGPLSVVILDFISTNKFFDRPYKEGEAVPPACFAIGTDPKKLVPSSNSPDKQADDCESCPNNQFGSKGNGKACGNHRLLLVRAGIGDDASDPQATKFKIQLSPTAIRAFDAYVSSVGTMFSAPVHAVVTDIFFDPKSDYPTLRFGNPQPNVNLVLHMKERAAARESLLQEPDVSTYEKPKSKK